MSRTEARIPTGRFWLAGGAVSLALHAGLAWYFNQDKDPQLSAGTSPTASAIRLVMKAPETVATPIAAAQPESKPAPKPAPQPIKKAEPKPKPKPKPKPNSQPDKLPEPVLAKTEPTKPVTEPSALPEKVQPEPIASTLTEEPAATQIPVITSKTADELRDEHLAELVRRINQNKLYPKRARKRNIEGSVSFVIYLDGQGNLKHFEWKQGNRLFYKSTLQSVRDSLPLPLPEGEDQLTYTLALAYKLI